MECCIGLMNLFENLMEILQFFFTESDLHMISIKLHFAIPSFVGVLFQSYL